VPEETEKGILKNIQTLLEDQKSLFLILNQDKLDEIKKKLVKPGTIESQVYDLCDGANTSQVIAGKIQKPPDYTSAVIGNLRRKGLVKTVESAGTKVYEQTF
jgi:hypothetical protein